MHYKSEGKKTLEISTSRLEAFSDGVIAIIITLMILEIKLPELHDAKTSAEVWARLATMLPNLSAYVGSFVVLGTIWISHHNFLQQVRHVNAGLLWHNLHTLFWASLIPLPTKFIGEHYELPEASAVYGFVMFMMAFAFKTMRDYAQDRAHLTHDALSEGVRAFAARLNRFATALYFISIFAGYVSIWLSIGIFILVPMLYFVPPPLELKE